MAQSEEPTETARDKNAGVSAGQDLASKPAQKASQKSAQKQQSSGGKFTLFLAFIAFMLAAASAGWQGYQFWLEQFAPVDKAWVEDINKLELRFEAHQREQQQAQKELQATLGAGQQSLQERLQAMAGETDAALTQQLQSITWVKQRQQALDERLQALVKVSREDWILAEADYLLRLAQQRLQLGGNGNDAEPLLAAAQRNLQLVHDKGIERVREVLAADLDALETARQFDLAGLDSRVANLSAKAQMLTPLGDRPLAAEAVADAQTPPPELAFDTVWPLIKYAVASAAEKLQSYIRISDRDGSYQQTVIAGGQRELFRQNLQLLFEQARWALLSGNAELYRQSLQRSEQWLRQYYSIEDAEQAVLDELAELQQQPVRAELPPISNSIAALQYFIDSRHGATETKP